jgi:hypothetical protein
MDVEGAEWGALASLDDETLERFDQITMEIHSLESLPWEHYRKVFVKALTKLNEQFTLFHVHANNVDGPDKYHYVEGMPVSCLLEVSYIRTSLVNRRPSNTLYPTEVDYPNMGARDRLLWIYPFLPNDAGKFALSLDSANPG